MNSSALSREAPGAEATTRRASDCRCAVCHNREGNTTFIAREMMFGLRDPFEYLECAQCGCVQLEEAPADFERYYPDDYFPEPPVLTAASDLKATLLRQRARYCLTGRGLLGRALVARWGRPRASIFGSPDYYAWLRRCEVDFDSSILDIGCGLGSLLARLHNDGFSRLTGVDPFIHESVHYAPGFAVLKQELHETDGEFDLVMLHHTFEHMPQPAEVLQHIYKLLRPRRYALIRIPIASSLAYRMYGGHWVQLDAPRHLFLHSVDSVRLLAERAGFKVADVVYDSDEFQFWGSEQYVNDIPLKDARSYAVDPRQSMFDERQIREFRTRANELNARGEGDSACFYLYKFAAG